MNIRQHFLSAFAATLFVYPDYGYLSLIILFTGVLMDFDHVLHYAWTKKSLNLKKAYAHYSSLGDASGVFLLFHFIEWLVVLLFLSLYSQIFFLVLIGALIHFILDAYHEKFIKSTGRQMSLIAWLISKRIAS